MTMLILVNVINRLISTTLKFWYNLNGEKIFYVYFSADLKKMNKTNILCNNFIKIYTACNNTLNKL